jgi:integrase
MAGNIERRGKSSWRLKFEIEPDASGKRQFRRVTVNGTKKDAERELVRLLGARDGGTLVNASKVTVEAYLWSWLDGKHSLSVVTVERYRHIIGKSIVPTLGTVELQKLKPAHVRDWLSGMMKSGRRNGGALTARTVRHSYRVLRGALQDAVTLELLARNVAAAVKPPKIPDDEIEILKADQIATVLEALRRNWRRLRPIVSLAVATGMRRGELLALRWSDVDLDKTVLNVERSLQESKSAGLVFKSPKTKHGRRTITLPQSAVAMLREHRKEQLELRLQLGMGKHGADDLVFCNHDGSPISCSYLSKMWRLATDRLPSFPKVSFHSLRHSHASALIAAGIDVVKVSRRLGHSSPVITLRVYAHEFKDEDDGAAAAIEAVLG